MTLDYTKLNLSSSEKQTDPRKIFTTLKRDPRFKRPLDEQADVLDAWFLRRTSKDLTLKMNTGGGKTVVGLLCLQSSLNESVKPAVYVTPDKFLATQVLKEAGELGISATEDEKDPNFLTGRAILVTNVFKLINGRSVFGVGDQKIPIGAIVVDDAHACLGVASEQFSLKSVAGSPVYDGLLDLFSDDLNGQSATGFLDIQAQDPNAMLPVPFWAWQAKIGKVQQLLHAHREEPDLEWSWRLLENCIPLCNCVFGGGRLEIAPRFIPIQKLPSFERAQRRIYMTATLADDGVLVSNFGADADAIAQPIRPKGGGDIGDRMILSPQEINPEYTTDQIKEMLVRISEELNVVVIVPSQHRSNYWKSSSDQVLTKANISEGVERLKNGHVGLTVIINKYDGIDLPGEACELLVIDGLPEVSGLLERLEMNVLDGTNSQLVRQVQRIEQGMGRGVRSSDDHCVILLLGGKLTQRLHEPGAEAMFSPATRAQILLGRKVAEQIKNRDIDELESIIDLCLERDDEWVAAGRNAVVNAASQPGGNVDKNVVYLRKAFDAAIIGQYNISISNTQTAVSGTDAQRNKGYVKQQLAEYTNFLDPVKAQEIQLSALLLNHRLVRPISGINYQKLQAPSSGQATACVEFMRRFIEGNDLLIWVNGLQDELVWNEEWSHRFEAAMRELGSFLGFGSQRPEEETGRGPDNLWALGSLKYLVIECKSGATGAPKISKKDTNQLNGSMVWFEDEYDSTCSATPLLVHPRTVFESAASPHASMRIMNGAGLQALKTAIRSFATALASSSGYLDAKEVSAQLKHHRLDAAQIVALCSVKPGA
tara:strand:- start:138 stop:2609 length:2472 start_codon:yes stop_codon:yes gene_type:complete